MSEPLKPCPFCGRTDAGTMQGEQDYWEVYCECGVSGPLFMTEQEATASWNRRASPWINFRERRPEDGQECWIIYQEMQFAPEREIERAWADYQSQRFKREAQASLYWSDITWLLWQPVYVPSPPTEAEIERAKGEAK